MKKLLLLAVLLSSYAHSSVTTIMCIGDSLTWGATANGTPAPGGYRDQLCLALFACYQQVQFVGPLNDNSSETLINRKSTGHAGYRGYRIDELCACLDGPNPYPGNKGYWFTVSNFNPDIILLMAGTNDILQGKGVANAVNDMDIMIAKIYKLRPKSTVLLAQIPPIFGSVASQVVEFNNAIFNFEFKYLARGMKIQVVDECRPLLPFSKEFADAVHPSLLVYNLMALHWLPETLLAIWQRS